jgi:predicted kinase
MCGMPGCGKSLIASLFNNAKIISADSLRYNDNGEYIYDSTKDAGIFQQTNNMCEEYMKQEISPIVIDNTNCHKNHPMSYIELANEYGYKVAKLFIPCKQETSLARNSHQVPKETIGMMRNNLIDHFNNEM